MQRARAVPLQRQTVRHGAVTLVPIPPPSGVQPSEVDHDPVPVNLGQYRSCSDTEKVGIGVLAGNHPAPELAEFDVVHNNHRLGRLQALGSGSHPEAGRLENVDAIDELIPDLAYHPPCATRMQPVCRLFTLQWTQLLGISDAIVVWNPSKGGRTNDDRTGERTPTDLVDTDHEISTPQEGTILLTEGFLPQLGTP